MRRAHVYVTWEQLTAALGLPGRPIKVWSEPDLDYLHVILEGDEFPERPAGSYVESTHIPELVKDEGVLRRLGYYTEIVEEV